MWTNRQILYVIGTRPEAIKLAPLILSQRELYPESIARICATGQHRELLSRALAMFDLSPDWDLQTMTPGQSLSGTSARILSGLEPVLRESKPHLVCVQGDTLTTLCGALAAFWERIPVVHVEAGLRTFNPAEPFPEEMNRVLTSRLASLHCAPAQEALRNLQREGVPSEAIVVTGNTGIDALFRMLNRIGQETVSFTPRLSVNLRPHTPGDRHLVLVTAHRRENFGPALERICGALAQLAKRPDVHIVFPVHPNPEVRSTVQRILGNTPVELTDPLDYPELVALLSKATFVISDSGGIQEEAPSIGKPVLILRERTERPEPVNAGAAILVGTDSGVILREAERLLDNPGVLEAMSNAGRDLFGSGHASEQILNAISQFFAA